MDSADAEGSFTQPVAEDDSRAVEDREVSMKRAAVTLLGHLPSFQSVMLVSDLRQKARNQFNRINKDIVGEKVMFDEVLGVLVRKRILQVRNLYPSRPSACLHHYVMCP
jgi:hypothetical protein